MSHLGMVLLHGAVAWWCCCMVLLLHGLARDYVGIIEGLYFSLDEALGLFGLLLQLLIHLLVYDSLVLRK